MTPTCSSWGPAAAAVRQAPDGFGEQPGHALQRDQVLGSTDPVHLPVGQPADQMTADERGDRSVDLRGAHVVPASEHGIPGQAPAGLVVHQRHGPAIGQDFSREAGPLRRDLVIIRPARVINGVNANPAGVAIASIMALAPGSLVSGVPVATVMRDPQLPTLAAHYYGGRQSEAQNRLAIGVICLAQPSALQGIRCQRQP